MALRRASRRQDRAQDPRGRASTRAFSSTSTSPIASPDEVEGTAVVNQGQRNQELLRLDERRTGAATPITGSPSSAALHARQRHRPLGHRQPAHLGHAAAPRHDRRADADALRAGFRLMTHGDGSAMEPGSMPDAPARMRTHARGRAKRPSSAASFILSLRARASATRRVLRAMELVPRELFAPRRFADLARTDVALPLPCGQTMTAPAPSRPCSLALGVEPGQRVLEIGTGTRLRHRAPGAARRRGDHRSSASPPWPASAAQHLKIVEAGQGHASRSATGLRRARAGAVRPHPPQRRAS